MCKIRMGVIGIGGIAENVHIPGIMKSPDAELSAICDTNKGILDKVGSQFLVPVERRFTDYQELLMCREIDAVCICTPNDMHFPIAIKAIDEGRPIALEKPVALNYKDALKLQEQISRKSLPNMVCFSYRFKSAARYARKIIKDGQLGEIYHVYGQYFQDWGINENLPLDWRFVQAKSGSGALGDLGSHIIDLVRFLVGDFLKVTGHTGIFIKKRKDLRNGGYGMVDADDYCNFMAEISGGIPGVFEISRYAYGRGNYQRIEIYGSKGALIYSLEDEDTLEICIGDIYKEARTFNRIPVPEQYKADQMQAFFNIINLKAYGLAATIEDGAISQMVIDGIINSVKSGQWVSLSKGGEKSEFENQCDNME